MNVIAMDEPIICQFDQTEHENMEALHAHIKRFRISREKYYRTYWPRFDKLTGEAIPFKDVEQYLTADFANKVNLKKWFKQQPAEEGLAWGRAWLERRKEDKQLVYAPSQVELRTLCCPSMSYYEEAAAAQGGYYGVTEALGYKPRYSSHKPVFSALPADAIVIQDTREQAPVKLPVQTTVATLNVGDYALAAPHDAGIRIERKSLSDFCGTLSKRKVEKKGGRDGTGETEDSPFARFDRELARATEAGLYVIMMVEANINDAQHFDWLPQTKWVRATPSHVLHNLRDLLVKYPLTFQAVFCDGRTELRRVMMRVLQLGAAAKSHDLQFLLEEGVL